MLVEVKFNRKYTKEQINSTAQAANFVGGTFYVPSDVSASGYNQLYYCKTTGTNPILISERNEVKSIKLGDSVDEHKGTVTITPSSIGAYTKSEVDVKIDEKIGSVYKYKGSVATRSALTDKTGTSSNGDVWNVESDGMNYAFIANETGKKYSNCTLSASSKINGKQCMGSSGQYFYENDVVEVYDADYKKENNSVLSIETLTVTYIDSKSALGMVAKIGTTTYYLKSELAEGTDLVMTTNVADAYTLTTHTESGIWDALGSMFDLSGLATKEELETALNNIIDGVNDLEAQLLVDENTWSNALATLTGRVDVLANGLGTAAACDKATSVTSGGTGLPTAGAVYNFVNEASEISKDLFLFGKGHDIFQEFIEGEGHSSYYNSTTKYYNIPVGTGVVTDEQISKMLISATDANTLIEEKVSGYGRKSMIVFDGDTLNASYSTSSDTFTITISNWTFDLQFNASYNGWQQISYRNTGTYVIANRLNDARTINGLKFDGSANVNNFFVCETPGDSDCKSISAPNITKEIGARIVVKFTNSCENISNGVEITIDNNIEHASPIVLGDGTNVMEHLVAGVYDMVYDGANWVILSGCGSKTYWEE